MGSVEKLILVRKSFNLSLEKSKSLGLGLDKTGPRLGEIILRLSSVEAAVRPIRASKDALASVVGHIDRAVGPAAAVLKVFDAVHGLEDSLLSDPRSDLPGYLAVLKRLEEALRFLGDNCGLAVQWLEDIVEYLEDNVLADERYLSELKRVLTGLREGNGGETGFCLDGGLLESGLDRLEEEFRRLLIEHSFPLPMCSSDDDQSSIAPSPLPVLVIQKLQAILGRLVVNGRVERCVSIYVEIRSSNVRASLKALDLDYLEISVAEFNDVHSIEGYITNWGKHLEFAVKHLFEAEYKLCNDVFERLSKEIWTDCFSRIASQAGILSFLKFGKTISESKKDPIKLLKLLDIFSSLNKLRLDFNRLFGGAACADIQKSTRDLIRRVVDGASEIFWELMVQVELQRQTPPPPDGSVPRLLSFITDYCNRLLGDDYKPILTQVLVIQRSWKNEKFQEKLLTKAILEIIKAIEQNLDAWSKMYTDDNNILANLFLMNNHWHLFKHLKGTKLGNLLGDSWLKEHEQSKEYHAAIYLRETWGTLPTLLSREGLILFSGGRGTARDLVKRRLKKFNETLDETCRKQSTWVISDKELREKTWQLIVQAIVPVYKSYMQNYGPLVEQESSSTKYAKYTAQSLEKTITSLFMPKPNRLASFKSSFKTRQQSGKFNVLPVDQAVPPSPSPPAAAAAAPAT